MQFVFVFFCSLIANMATILIIFQQNFALVRSFQPFAIKFLNQKARPTGRLINISIPGYNFFHCNSSTIVGGIGVYFKQNIKVERTNKFTFNMNVLEEIWFEFARTNSLEKHKRIFGCNYRHSS